MRLPLIAICTALLSLAFAGSASAHQPLDAADFSFVATIDCGDGPIHVIPASITACAKSAFSARNP